MEGKREATGCGETALQLHAGIAVLAEFEAGPEGGIERYAAHIDQPVERVCALRPEAGAAHHFEACCLFQVHLEQFVHVATAHGAQ